MSANFKLKEFTAEDSLLKAARNELPVPTFRIGLGFFVGRLTA